jgi:hypothetical protein
MKRFLDFFLLNRNIFKRPVKLKTGLLLLIFAAGLVMLIRYSIRTEVLNSFNAVILGIALSVFTGVLSVVLFSWPSADFLSSLNPEVDRFHLNIKRIKLAKGFLYAVILTGTTAGIMDFFLVRIVDMELSRILITIVSILSSLWAGGIISRCAFAVFEKAEERKKLVFFILTIWYYIIVIQAMDCIIRIIYNLSLQMSR